VYPSVACIFDGRLALAVEYIQTISLQLCQLNVCGFCQELLMMIWKNLCKLDKLSQHWENYGNISNFIVKLGGQGITVKFAGNSKNYLVKITGQDNQRNMTAG
jgi:hypothetical protein